MKMMESTPAKIGVGNYDFGNESTISMTQSMGLGSFERSASASKSSTPWNSSFAGSNKSIRDGFTTDLKSAKDVDDANMMGQRILSNVGVDTHYLFQKARDLSKENNISSRADSKSSVASLHQNNRAEPSRHVLHPHLETSLENHRVAILENIILESRQRTQALLEEKINQKILSSFKTTSLSACNSGSMVQGRRIPSVISDDPSLDRNYSLPPSIPTVPIRSDDLPLIEAHYHAIASSFFSNEIYEQHDLMAIFDNLITISKQYDLPQYMHAVQLCRCLASMPRVHPIKGISAAYASVQFLTDTFQDHILSTVKNQSVTSSSLQNARTEGGVLGFIHQYVEIEVGRDALQKGHSEIFWRLAYYALRCGNFMVLNEIVKQNHALDDTFRNYVGHLASLCDKDGKDNLIRVVNAISGNSGNIGNLLDYMKELYRRAETRLGSAAFSGGEGVYELAALGLLCFIPIDTSSPLSATIEDYIFLGIWHTLISDKDAGTESILTLANLIKSMGANYFEDGISDTSNNTWSYTMPLLLCNQLKSGLYHLAGKSALGLSQAVHLGLVLSSFGVSLSDLQISQSTDTSERDLCNLITIYSKSLQAISVTAALDYLVLIPGTDSAVRFKNGNALSKEALSHISRLIVDSNSYDEIAGLLSDDGSRLACGALDKHFATSEVSTILEFCAEQCRRERSDRDAAHLLSLSGKYGLVLSLLNQKLSSQLVSDSAERNSWFTAAKNFQATYLTNRHTYVLKILENENNLHLGNTFQFLLNLMVFFDRCRGKEWENAWGIVNDLNIFPSQKNEIASKAEAYSNLDLSIQSIFHHVIVKAMESLFEQYSQCKVSLAAVSITKGGSDAAGALVQKREELRRRAGLLLTFAGLISMNLDGETKAKIARFEAQMV